MSIERGGIDWEADLLAASHRAARRRAMAHESEAAMKTFLEAHANFYTVLISAVNNSWLIWLHRMLFVHSERYSVLCVPVMDMKIDLYDPRSPFMAAVLARDAETAVALMREQYEVTTQTLLDQFRSGAARMVTDQRADASV
jgi:GntR family carbon starvation induced transcriptional regulator